MELKLYTQKYILVVMQHLLKIKLTVSSENRSDIASTITFYQAFLS